MKVNVYMEHWSVPVFIRDGKCGKVGVETRVPVPIRKTDALQLHFRLSLKVSQTEVTMSQQRQTSHAEVQSSS